METLQHRENAVEAKRLKRKFTGALLALLITFLAVASATYAWYIYNTSQHTTNVRMAAGAGSRSFASMPDRTTGRRIIRPKTALTRLKSS